MSGYLDINCLTRGSLIHASRVRISGSTAILNAVAVFREGSHVGVTDFLRGPPTICDPGSYAIINATLFDRETTSRHNQHRSDRHIRTLKKAALVDTDLYTVSIFNARHTGHMRRKLAVKSLYENRTIEILAGEKGYDDQLLRGCTLFSRRPALAASSVVCCLRSRTQRTVGQRFIRLALDDRDHSSTINRFGPTVHPHA